MSKPIAFPQDPRFREDIAQERQVSAWLRTFKGLAQAATRRLDGWGNTLTGLGMSTRDRSIGLSVQPFCPLTWWELDMMYHGNDLPGIIVDRLPTDALSSGFSFGDAALDQAAERWRLEQQVLDARIWARLYGRGGLYMGVAGPQDAPLRLADVGPGMLEFLMPLDHQDLSIAEYDTDPNSPTHQDPLMYRIGSNLVHPSRLILFPGSRTSPTQRERNGGWDLSVLQRPYNVLRDTEYTWRSIMAVMSDLSQSVFAIKNLSNMISSGHKGVVMDRMEIVDQSRSVARAVVIDADAERFEHIGAQNLTGIDPLLVRVFTRLAAAADMPLTVLMGMSPAGMNATGESDLAIWYKKCKGERKILTPGIHYLGALIARSEGLEVPAGVEWPALWELTDQEQADLDGKRAAAAKTWIEAQVSTPEEERRIAAGEPRADVMGEADPLASFSEAEEVTEDAVDPDLTPDPGEIWTDTRTDTRLEIVRTGGGYVYFRYLDGPKAGRQWRWRTESFLTWSAPSDETAPTPTPPDPEAPPA